MKRIISLAIAACLVLLASIVPAHTEAQTEKATSSSYKRNSKGEIIHVAQAKESVAEVAKKYGVSLEDLKKKNNLITTATIEKGEELVLPRTFTSQEKDLMARLVNAEAKGEPYKGKVAVAAVVLNRVESDKFPNTISGVINAKRQFTPVANGQIKKPASTECKKAVNEAIALQEQLTEATFFYNPNKTNDKWIKSLPVLEKIGNHNFARS
ncbi:cell wall hydrolase [Bacillus testis]|uniref:cell wall hydrolase n=1 Tax=Bacillus testis TaxID=1622072 RepID=UPI00067E9E9C|nr:cell wall hydrolase [Bacillus testis]